jgi:hypothetical protein
MRKTTHPYLSLNVVSADVIAGPIKAFLIIIAILGLGYGLGHLVGDSRGQTKARVATQDALIDLLDAAIRDGQAIEVSRNDRQIRYKFGLDKNGQGDGHVTSHYQPGSIDF